MVENYQKYDYLFKNIKPNAIGDIVILSEENDWRIKQDFNCVSNEEYKIWNQLFSNIIDLASNYGSKEFRNGLIKLNLNSSQFPSINQISNIIKKFTDWEVVTVAGFLDEFLFFKLNASRQFPSTDIIRQSHRFSLKYQYTPIKNEFGYTPEPDIFHDVFGHMPFLTDQNYCNFIASIGQLGFEILKNERNLSSELVAHNLKRLQNFAWWTYEFGIMINQNDNPQNNLKYQIYGAGILSSYDEILNIINCSKGLSNNSIFIPYDIEEIALMRFDYSEIQDRYFVIDSMEHLYKSFIDNKEIFLFNG